MFKNIKNIMSCRDICKALLLYLKIYILFININVSYIHKIIKKNIISFSNTNHIHNVIHNSNKFAMYKLYPVK